MLLNRETSKHHLQLESDLANKFVKVVHIHHPKDHSCGQKFH